MCRPVLFLWEREDRERDAREACAACRRGFVGGWLLGCRNSAKTVFQKSELASCSRSDSGLLKNNADFRQPRISSPPAESGDRQHTPHELAFQGGSVCGGLLGSWMSRQRCAGRLVGEAEFACGLTVGVWGRRRCAGRQGGKAEFACGLTGDVWDRCRCAGRQGGKVGVPCDLMGVSE